MTQNPLVSIGVVTYNQENYIRECLDSILIQYTEFSYEIVVADDASVDNTSKILMEYKSKYPDIFNIIIRIPC